MTGLAFVCGVLPMAIAHGAGGASQQALGTSVMGGMIAVVILALLMVPVFFVSVQRVLAGDREPKVEEEAASEPQAAPAYPRRRVDAACPEKLVVSGPGASAISLVSNERRGILDHPPEPSSSPTQ